MYPFLIARLDEWDEDRENVEYTENMGLPAI